MDHLVTETFMWSILDSPGAPVSAHSKEIFRGFSFIAATDENMFANQVPVQPAAPIPAHNTSTPSPISNIPCTLNFSSFSQDYELMPVSLVIR